jgi:hypothetical protein
MRVTAGPSSTKCSMTPAFRLASSIVRLGRLTVESRSLRRLGRKRLSYRSSPIRTLPHLLRQGIEAGPPTHFVSVRMSTAITPQFLFLIHTGLRRLQQFDRANRGSGTGTVTRVRCGPAYSAAASDVRKPRCRFRRQPRRIPLSVVPQLSRRSLCSCSPGI